MHDDQRGTLRTITSTPVPTEEGWVRRYWTGLPWQLGTAAYWEELARHAAPLSKHRLGNSLREEIGACLIGGYGVSKAMAAAAFERLRSAGVFDETYAPSRRELERLLMERLTDYGFPGRYRFPSQRSARLADALAALGTAPVSNDDRKLRSDLLELPGVGPKTASWIVRNFRGSEQVAVIDIHVVRAGTSAGVFDEAWSLPRHYFRFEQAFLAWSEHAGLSAIHLDECIWGHLNTNGTYARDILGVARLTDLPRACWSVEAAQMHAAIR